MLLFCLDIGRAGNAEKPLLLEGAWTVVEVQMIRSNGDNTVIKPQESLVLFARGYYSFTWTSQQLSTPTWQLTDSNRVARFNSSLVNAGTYKVTNSLLVTHALFALAPKFVGGEATFRYESKGDTLILNGVNVLSADSVPLPFYENGGHIITTLVRVK
jgi:hypothetical protein